MLQSETAAHTTSEPLVRPLLAPSTWLVGQLVESALVDPPWAVEQAKRGYVQMGELAYRVAEQADGQQTLEEIATTVSTALRRPVSAMDVEALIDTVLIPRGVIRPRNGEGLRDDDAVAPTPGVPAHGGRRRGPRSSRAPGQRREIVVGPARIGTVVSILMWLFWPPVVLVLGGLALAALVWLYAFHGLAQSVIQVLAVPVLLPITLAVTGLVAAVSSIGPMVALHSGGATIQRLRIAPALRRPIVEVDVADDYGLSRWARLAVSVSGIYFQAVVTLVLCVLGWMAGAEFLFLSATLLTLNMLFMLVPFGRPGADGLLADVLLVQQPLRYAAQALDRYLPAVKGAAAPLPPLKRWGSVTIALYLFAVGIALLVVGLVLLRTMPTVVATIFEALAAYLVGMAAAVGDRDALGFVTSLFNAAVLATTIFGLTVWLIVVLREKLARAWGWGRQTPRRRLLGGRGAIVFGILVVLCWVPVLGLGGNGPPRSLAGISYRSLTGLSRGTLFDLRGGAPTGESPLAAPGDRPTVTDDIGTGAGGPQPGAPTPTAAPR